jgi:isoquinoline 1-oxidoreductase alpha subunit
MPLLWALRDVIGLTGTKFGCGMGACGSCMVHVDGKPVKSCTIPSSDVAGKSVTTIEGLPADSPVIRAWAELDVAQCGWCQPGQIMSAAALVAANAEPKDAEIDDAMNGNLCRCGTYQRIRGAVKRAAELKRGK